MKLTLSLLAATSMLATAAYAQESPPPASPAPAAPVERMAPPSDSKMTPSDSTVAPSTDSTLSTPSDTTASAGPTLSDDEAKAWINKVVYSSDDKNVGEISAIERDASGAVKEVHADIGGFLGLGETRVRVMPSQIKFVGDRAVLNVTSEEAKKLPKIEG